MKFVIAALLACLCAPLAAQSATPQVGSTPEKSPYQDFNYHQDFTLFGGYFSGDKGEAKVGPQSSSIIGVRYAIHVGGPAELEGRISRAFSSRNIVDPTKIGAAQHVGSESDPLTIADVGVNFALTGQKTWHHIIPFFGFGVGFAHSGTPKDVGTYAFGTAFAIHAGLGAKLITRGPFAARVDISDYLWQLGYPGSYLLAPTGGQAILASGQAQNEFVHNAVVTLGLSYIYRR